MLHKHSFVFGHDTIHCFLSFLPTLTFSTRELFTYKAFSLSTKTTHNIKEFQCVVFACVRQADRCEITCARMSDDSNETSTEDECILYELLVYSEWKQEPELSVNSHFCIILAYLITPILYIFRHFCPDFVNFCIFIHAIDSIHSRIKSWLIKVLIQNIAAGDFLPHNKNEYIRVTRN